MQVLKSLGIRPFAKRERTLRRVPDVELCIKEPYGEFSGFEQVRILLFRERFGQERKLLFDSKAVKKRDKTVSTENVSSRKTLIHQIEDSSIEKSFKFNATSENEYIYESQKSGSEEEMFREMIFGSVSISYIGTTMKVHTIRSPFLIMISAVFPAPSMNVFRSGEEECEGSLSSKYCTKEKITSKSCELPFAHSVPVNVPSREYSHHENDKDSISGSPSSQNGYTSLPGYYTSPQENTLSLPRSCSYNNLQRRLLRNKATSIEFGLQKLDIHLQCKEYSNVSVPNRVKLGLSVIINLKNKSKEEERQFQDFLFAHIALIESHVLELRNTVSQAYINRKNFVHLMYEGSKRLQHVIEDLYTAPRLQFPEWLTMVSSSNYHDHSRMFLQKMSSILKVFDKKETNFFFSTLLTAVLTYHIAWVPTVIPSEAKLSPSQNSYKQMPRWVDMLSQSRPYNPLWVQLGDLYGALSFPFKFAKTVVTGSNSDVVIQFLQVISYFIRCSEISEIMDERTERCNSIEGQLKGNRMFPTSNVSADENETSNVNLHFMGITESKLCVPIDNIPLPANINTSVKCDMSSACDEIMCSNLTIPACMNKKSVTTFRTEDSDSVKSVSPSLQTSFSNNYCCDSLNGITYDSLGYESLEEKSDNACKSNISNIEAVYGNCDTSTKYESCLSKPGNRTELCSEQFSTTSTKNNCAASYIDSAIIPHKSELNSSDHDNQAISLLCKNENLCNNVNEYKQDNLNYVSSDSGCSTTSKDSGSPEKTMSNSTSSSGSEEKQCDSLEDGYHSMEEIKSPQYMSLSQLIEAYDNWAPEGLQEVPVPQSKRCQDSTSASCKNFGWSLMAGLTDHFLSDFCLQGVCGILEEEEIRKDLKKSTQIDTLGDSVTEAVCILANTDTWSVKILSSKWTEDGKLGSSGFHIGMSSLVSSACDSVLGTINLGLPPESCLIHLEDKLQELYFHSLTLAEYLCNIQSVTTIDSVAAALNFSTSDIPLLLSIAIIHTPYLAAFNQWCW